METGASQLSDVDYQIVFDASLDASFIHTTEGQILAANWTAVELYGYSLEEFKQLHISELSMPELRHEISNKLGELQTLGEIFEWQHCRKDGSELAVEIYAQPIVFQDRLAILANVRDISQRKQLESELQDKQHLLERILATEPGTVYLYDLLKQQNVYINRHWLAIYGFSPEEAQAMDTELINYLHPDDRERITAYLLAWETAAAGVTRSIEYRLRDKAGNWHWLLSRDTAFSIDGYGQVSQILGIAHDISSRKRAEALQTRQKQVLEMITIGAPLPEVLSELIRSIEAHSPDLLGSVLLLDPDGVHMRHGAAPSLPAEFVAALDGQPIGPVAGSCGTAAYRREAVFVADIESDPLWQEYKAVALAHGLRASWSTPILDSQGQVLATFAMYYREPGLPQAEHLKLIETTTQIAAIAISRYRSEKVLRESEARYRLLFDYAPDGILIADPDSYYLDANASACQLLGYSRDELIGLHASDIVKESELDYIEPALDAIKARSDYAREWQLRRKDGSVFFAEVKATAMPDGNLLGVIHDISERKAAEAKVQRLTQLYAALSQCNQVIVRCTSEEKLFPAICRDAVEFGGMKMAWIGLIDATGSSVTPVASFGAGTEYLEGIDISLAADTDTGRGPTATAMREDRPCWCQDFQHDQATSAWHERGAQFGWAGSAALPLHRKGVVIGAFNLYASEVNAFDESAQKLLVEMAKDISYALDRFASEAERKQAEAALRISEQHLRTIIETEPECVKLIDAKGRLLHMNAAGLAMLEVDSLQQARQHNLLDFIHSEYRSDFSALHQRVMGGESAVLEFEITGLKGARRWLETHAAPLRDASGEISSLLGITRDVTEHKLSEERIKYLANFDALTGLPNRSQLDDHLKYALSLAKRNDGHLAVMFIDLDHFKDINDTLGHSIGDAFLVEVARRLLQVLREEDTATRLGGDEFILMLPESDAQGAVRVAEKVLEIISRPYHIEQYDLAITASIGIALYPDDGTDLETLSRSADTAMYRAKQEGRDGYRFFTAEMQARASRNMQLVNALRLALKHDELQVHYQPQVSLVDGHLIGVEALIRWQNPKLGMVSPAEFIPVAEDSGLILPIGEWVLRTAVQQLKRWIDAGYAPMVVAVNLSAIQFRHHSLPEMVTRILKEADLSPEYLELELTEGVAMYDPQAAIAVMNTLHELGIRMSIDDFGTGYSSLNYLKKFKVYKLKIDQSFVHDISTDQEDRAIVAAIISMSGDLGLQTIAEGVETAEQLAFLRAQGCDEAQGYYFSKPLPADQMQLLLDAGFRPDGIESV